MAEKSLVNDVAEIETGAAVVPVLAAVVLVVFFDELHAANVAAITTTTPTAPRRLSEIPILLPPFGFCGY
jgi:hypothetical protein